MSMSELMAKNVRMLREIRGLSQHQFGEKLGLTNTYVSRIEGGSLNISLKVVERLAKALEVPFKMLFEEDLLSLPLSAFERFPYDPEEKEKLRVEKERIKEQLRQDALRFRKALEVWEGGR